MTSPAEVRAEWLAQLHSTQPADRPRAEAGVRALYAAAGFQQPDHVLWYPSPYAASWAVAALVPKEDRASAALLDPAVLSSDDRRRLDASRADLVERVGAARWEDVTARIGESRVATLQRRMDPSRLFSGAILEARYGMVDNVASLFRVPGDDDDLARAEAHFWGSNWGVIGSAVHCPTTDFLLRQSFVGELTFSMLADDIHRAGDRALPAVLGAAVDVARSAGMWWPYENAVIVCDRPAEVHVDEQQRPHRENGPAIAFRDGWQLYAWHGKAVPERWITDTASVPAGEYRGFDPGFVKWAKSRQAPSESTQAPSKGAKQRTRPASILEAPLPSEPAARLDTLRTYAEGRLPYYDRYVSGAHREVWSELVALGPAVRAAPYAADALAVAYETMQRVDENVRTLVERLGAMGYVFSAAGGRGRGGGVVSQLGGLLASLLRSGKESGRASGATGRGQPGSGTAHVPPSPTARDEIAGFEKEFGVLPLSLRTFYEVVGEVNLMGRHPTIDPPNNRVAPDPLVVYGLDEGMVIDEEDEEEGGTRTLMIAPDDLHKANTSGGDPYTMTVPDLRADGELLDERHRLFFVDYLRLSFRFGGFPGYEGTSAAPAELGTLAEGLRDL